MPDSAAQGRLGGSAGGSVRSQGRRSWPRKLPAVVMVTALVLASLAWGAQSGCFSAVAAPPPSSAFCRQASQIDPVAREALTRPWNLPAAFEELRNKSIWSGVITALRVNQDKANPCFGSADTPAWQTVVSRIPADVVGIQATRDRQQALIYVSGIPDFKVETPKLFTGFKPGNIQAIYRIAAAPEPDPRPIHELSSKGAIGLFVNGVSIFNYTDTFSYNEKGSFTYDANVAEASIVNSDISHATPSNTPGFPASRGIFHNHQVSQLLLKQLQDPFALGILKHSKRIGYAIDSFPIYGPIGYTSADTSSGLKVLRSSYIKRSWLSATPGGSPHRSSLPGWVVLNWDGANATGRQLLNLAGKSKAEMLFTDGAKSGPVSYTGSDAKLADEIRHLSTFHTLERDDQGYVYWQSELPGEAGRSLMARNYLLKSSDLWGPDIGTRILPVSYQSADPDKFYFNAVIGTFAEDYEFVHGYGDLDFFNGINSFVPDQARSIYHYACSFETTVNDPRRASRSTFPYVVGVQFKGKPDPFNDGIDQTSKLHFFATSGDQLDTIFDLGVIGRDGRGRLNRGSVPQAWQQALTTP